MSGCCEETAGLLRCEEADEASGGVPRPQYRSPGHFAQLGFQLSEDHVEGLLWPDVAGAPFGDGTSKLETALARGYGA